MKIKDTFHGIMGEAMRLIFNREKIIFFDQYASIELEKPASNEEWIASHPEAHFYEYHVTGYVSSLLYVGGMYNYVPKEPQEYYDSLSFARKIEKFNTVCLLYLLNPKEGQEHAQMMKQYEEIVADTQKMLEKNKSDKFLFGNQYTIADFAFMGLFLASQDQPIAQDILTTIKKYKSVDVYAIYHREAFLPYLIEGGRFITCYASPPYSTLFQLVMSYQKIKSKIVEAKEPVIVIAGVKYTCFTSALEMLARTLGLLNNDHIFENLYYRDIASSILFSDKVKTPEQLAEPLNALNNYYGYMRAISPDKKWQITLSDIYAAVALESCCMLKEVCSLVKEQFSEAYEFQKDFMMRYKRAKHCIILKSAPGPDTPLPPDSVALLNFMNRCRYDLHDIMRNMGFQTVETIHPYLKGHEETLSNILARKDYQAGDVEIFAYIDANQNTDFMLGYTGVKFMEDRHANFAGCSYDFAYCTYDKVPMKKLFIENGIPTSPYAYMDKWDDGEAIKKGNVLFPVLVKLSDAYASFGMSKDSKCQNIEQLKKVVESRLAMYNGHPLLIESFIEGPEYTVIITGIYDKDVHIYRPIHRAFDENIPEGDRWLYFEFYWKSPVQKLFFKKVADDKVADELTEIARKAYASVKGNGYGRVDIRQDKRTGKFLVLEVNCMCAVGFETTSFYGLRECGLKSEDLFEKIFYYGKLKCSQK